MKGTQNDKLHVVVMQLVLQLLILFCHIHGKYMSHIFGIICMLCYLCKIYVHIYETYVFRVTAHGFQTPTYDIYVQGCS